MEPNPVGLQPGTLTLDFSQPMATGALAAALFHDSRRGSGQQLPTSGVGTVTRDAYGRMWFGQDASLLMFDGRRWMTYTQESGLGSGDITALYGAENGDLWVGYGSGSTAISRLRGTTWTHYPRQLTPSLNIERVTTIGEDGQGILWVGTSGGMHAL